MSDSVMRSAEEPTGPGSRRNFLDVLSNIFLSLWGIGFLGVVYSFLRPRHQQQLLEETFNAGALGDVSVGASAVVQHHTGPVMIVRTGENDIVAFSALCTHMRCIVRYSSASKSVICPCHGGAFDLRGHVLYGPPPRPLPVYSAEVRNGQIYVRLV